MTSIEHMFDYSVGMETLTVPMPSVEALAAMSAADRAAVLAALNHAVRCIEAATVDLVEVAERAGDHLADGHRSAAAWLTASTNCSPGEARARVQSARAMRTLPSVRAEFHAGRVGVAQVREIARLVANPRCGGDVADSEQILLDAARSLEYRDFCVVTQRWEQLADADGAHAVHERAHEFRDARLSQVGAEFRFETSHGVIAGAALREVFDAFVAAEFDADWAATVAEHGDAATKALMPRTAAQRRADAFLAMALAAAAAGVDGQPIDVVVNLVSDTDQFEQYVDEAITGDPADIDPSTVRDRRCETTDGIPVDPQQLVAAAFLGRIRHIVIDGAGVIIAAGQKRRLFNGALRDAIQAIDPVCAWLGCNLRAQLAQIDHLQPASRGGPTDAANAKVLCKKHNLHKHTHGYVVERQPDGTITITRPDGTLLALPDAA